MRGFLEQGHFNKSFMNNIEKKDTARESFGVSSQNALKTGF